MTKIFSYIHLYKKAAIIAILLMATELVVELVQPIIMSIIIDEGVMNQHLPTIWLWGAVLLVLTGVAFTAGIISSYYAAYVSQSVGHDLRRDLYKKVQSFSESEMQTFTTSTLITRMTNDVTQFQAFVFTGLRIMLRAPLFIIGSIIVSFTINVRFAVIFTIAVPMLLIILLWIMKKGVSLFQTVQEKLDKVNGIVQENLFGIRLVKAFHRENHETKRFNRINSDLMEVNKKALRIMELGMPIIMLGMNLAIVVVLWIGSREIIDGTVQPGELVAILNYGTRILASFGIFSFLLMSFTRGRASATRIADVLGNETSESLTAEGNNKRNIRGDIQFENVSLAYPKSNKPSISNISFSVKAGETVGVLGETGSGKSTMIQLIPGMYMPSSGHLYIDNLSVKEMDLQQLRCQVGLVTQEVHLFTGSIKDNISWGLEDATMDDVVQAAKEASIHDFIMELPDQYETLIGQRGVNLSGGQKQRLAMARVFIRNPKILLMDDSTSALDANTERKILKSIKSKKCTTIVVSQKISSVIEADHILLFQKGKIAAQGSHAELLETSSLYQQIFRSQMKEVTL